MRFGDFRGRSKQKVLSYRRKRDSAYNRWPVLGE
jgi:hypothetical protein